MIKLKNILKEGYAWERKADGSLPTLADTTAAHARKLRENHADIFDEIADELGLTPEQFDSALNSSRAELDVIENLYMSDSMTSREALATIADMLDVPFGTNESAKPDYIDADGDGDETESMKQAFKDKAKKKSEMNELSDEEIDKRWNKPLQNWERQSLSSKMDMMRQTSNNTADSSKSAEKAPSKFYQEKLAALKAQRKQLEFDMEQEAEPEGGPVADYYGEALQHIDDQIDSIKQKMSSKNESTNEATIITKAGLQEMRELPLEDRILRNLKGNDYILRETFRK